MPSRVRDAVLEVLKLGPAYGLELQRRTGYGWTVYAAARDLEREGILESYEVDAQREVRGGRPRRYYRLRSRP
jgi:DNA-binding PadR family transcriptional regulator